MYEVISCEIIIIIVIIIIIIITTCFYSPVAPHVIYFGHLVIGSNTFHILSGYFTERLKMQNEMKFHLILHFIL